MFQIVKIGKAILKHKENFFSIDQLIKETGLERIQVLRYLEELCRDGIITRARKCERCWGDKKKPFDTFLMIFRADQEKLAERIAPKLREETAQDRMWKVVRYLRVFTKSDLVRLAESGRENARTFLKMLRRGGYIVPSKQSGAGVEWRLIKDVGPRRPYVGNQKNISVKA